MKVAVIGLGKLGLPVAVTLSLAGVQVIGVDLRERITELAMQNFSTFEEGCNAPLPFEITDDYTTAVSHTEGAIICVNTPDGSDNNIDLTQLRSVVKELRQTLEARPKRDMRYKVLIFSTVMPGTADKEIIPELESYADVYSCPVWIAMGQVIRDLRNPPAIVIGVDSEVDPWWVYDLYEKIIGPDFSPKSIVKTDNKTAEFIKLAHNAWCTMKMSFLGEIGDLWKDKIDMNMLSYFFQNGGERPGAFWNYGPAFGGPCFPRDLRYFVDYSQSAMAAQALRVNMERIIDVVDRLTDSYPTHRLVIYGSTYKYGVPNFENALGQELYRILASRGRSVITVDLIGKHSLADGANIIGIVCQKEYLEMAKHQCEEVVDLWS